MRNLLAPFVLVSAFSWANSAHAIEDVQPEPRSPAEAPVAVAPQPDVTGTPAPIPELPPESDMHSVGMFAGGIALLSGGIVNSTIAIGLIVALTSQGGDGGAGVIAFIVGGPLLLDGTVQISIGIPMIVVGGSDAEPEPNPVEQAAATSQLPTRSGLTLAVPF